MIDEQQIERLWGTLTRPLRLTVHAGGDEVLAAQFKELAAELQALAPEQLTISGGSWVEVPQQPALSLRADPSGPVHYLALPEGLEAAPFVDLLLALAGSASPPPPPWTMPLKNLDDAAELMVFVSAACPHCAEAVRTAHALALASPWITTTVVDAQRYPGLAERYNVRSVPFTLLDGGLGWVGAVSGEELVRQMLSRGGAEHEVAILASLVDVGRLSELVEWVLAGPGAEHLATYWGSSSMSQRMALLVAVQQVLEANPHALDSVVERLLPGLEAGDPGMRGDSADLLGQIGHAGALPALRKLLVDANEDVAEAAQEAIEGIESVTK